MIVVSADQAATLTNVMSPDDGPQRAALRVGILLKTNKTAMKKILVPTDFSEASIEAVRFAANVARESQGELTLFNTIELPSLYNSSMVAQFESDFMKSMKQGAEREIEKIESKSIGAKVKVKRLVVFGGFLPTLKDTIKKEKPDVIIAGTTGASGVKEYTLGSTAEKIVRNSSVPVISVHKFTDQIKNIVFPTQPDLAQEALTMKVKELQTFFDAKLHVLYVNTPATFKRDSDIRPSLEKFVKRFMLKNATVNIYNDISEADGIINFVKDNKADMVAMATHGRKGLAHIASGSIAEDVVNHIKCPTWTFKIN